MVTTRSRSGAAPKLPDPDIALQHSFSNQSLLAWANGSRKNSKEGVVREAQNASILNLPLDLLAIIFSECHPLSLLNLGRTCYDLKLFFHSQAAKPIWLASRNTLSFTITEEDVEGLYDWDRLSKTGSFALPPCPSHFSEPAYTAFLFDPTCSFCGQMSSFTGTGSLTAHVCGQCYRNDFVTREHLETVWKKKGEDDPRIYDMLPLLETSRTGKKVRKGAKWFHKPTCDAILEKALQYEMDTNFNARLMNAFFTKGETEIKERDAFLAALSALESAKVTLIQVEAMRRNREAEERFNKNKGFVVLRLEQIVGETFSTDIDDCSVATDLIREHGHEMNDDDFANIKDRLVAAVQPVQEERRHITAYYDAENMRIRGIMEVFRATLFAPLGLAKKLRLADFLELATVKALAANPDFINGDRDAQKTLWKENLKSIHEDIASWITTQENAVLALMEEKRTRKLPFVHHTQRHVYETALSKEYLRKPFTSFICTTCQDVGPSKLSEVLVHNCFVKYAPYSLPATRRRMNDEGIVTTGKFSSPLLITSSKLALDGETTSIFKEISDAIVEAGGSPPGDVASMRYRNKGTLFCADCAEGTAEHKGTGVIQSYKAHVGRSKTHRRFTYVPPDPNRYDPNDAFGSPDNYGGFGDDYSDDFDPHLPMPEPIDHTEALLAGFHDAV